MRSGSYSVEFAFAAPIFLVLTAGILEMGWFFNQQMSVTMAGRDAARAGSLALLDEEPVPEAEAHAVLALQAAGLDGLVDCSLDGSPPDARIDCSVDATYTGLIGLTPMPGHLRARSVMRLEEQR